MTSATKRGAGPLPDDHDCEECGCLDWANESGLHNDKYGFCLACGGCGDPECCNHDESCAFDAKDEGS